MVDEFVRLESLVFVPADTRFVQIPSIRTLTYMIAVTRIGNLDATEVVAAITPVASSRANSATGGLADHYTLQNTLTSSNIEGYHNPSLWQWPCCRPRMSGCFPTPTPAKTVLPMRFSIGRCKLGCEN